MGGLLTGFLPSSAAASIYFLKPPYTIHRVSPEFIGSRNYCVPTGRSMAFTAVNIKEVPNECCLAWQVTMDQLICASFSHTHYYYYYCVKSILCVCVCVFSSHSFWTSSPLDVPAGVTQEEGHTTGFLIHHLLSAVRALIFLARRIQPFFSLVDREVEFFCVLTI